METKIEAEAMDKIARLVEAYQKHDQEFDQLLLDDLRSDALDDRARMERPRVPSGARVLCICTAQ